MRLIDADELKKDIMSYKTMPEIRKAICEVIDDAPTVNDCPNCEYKLEADYIRSSSSYKELIDLRKFKEENTRPQGKWIERIEGHSNGYPYGGVNCSLCGYQTTNRLHLIFGCPYNYCPTCGADMRGGAE